MSADVAPSRLQLCLFCSLYALQGVVVAYFFNFNQRYLQAASPPIDAGTISLVQGLATAPLVLKFLVGPISDRWNLLGFGHRIPYIALGVLIQAGALASLPWIDPGSQLAAFTLVATLAVTGLAIYDTACDGLIVEVTPSGRRASVQGKVVAARFLATMIASWFFGAWLERTGNGPGRGDGVLWLCALSGLLPLVLAMVQADPGRAPEAERFQWRAFRSLVQPRALLTLAFGALYAAVTFGVEMNLSLFYAAIGQGDRAIGQLASIRYLGRACGALLLPLLAPQIGRSGVLVVCLAGLVAATAGQSSVGGFATAALWALAFGLANGWADTLFNVLCMEASDPRMAASTYALFMAVSNLGVLGGAGFGLALGWSAGRFPPVFLAGAAILLAALPLLRPLAQPANPHGQGGLSPA